MQGAADRPSIYHSQSARRRDPAKLPDRAKRDAALMPEIARMFEKNFRVCGVRKIRRQLKREGHDLARCTVARLMRSMGLQGVISGLHRGGLVHHSDRGSQYVSIHYTARLAQAGIEPSVGGVGDSYENALAESINGLY